MTVLFVGGNYLPKYLPLHLCSVNMILIAWHAARPNKMLDNFLYTTCVPGALMAVLFPNWLELPRANLMHIHSFTVHILLVAYPVMLLAERDISPEVKYLPKCLGFLAVLALIALVFNMVFGTNFMFLMQADEGTPLVWFRDHWGSHLWGFPVLIPLLLPVMYTPVLVRRGKRNTQNRAQKSVLKLLK